MVEQQRQSAGRKLGRTRLRRGTDAGRRTRRVADTTRCATDAPGRERAKKSMARLCARKYKNRKNSPCKRPEVDAIMGKKAFPSCR